ncbi:MAG: dihydroxy-acid dehydratase, partial [Ruthenibacterium sp.]
APAAAAGGPIALLLEGDVIDIDIPNSSISVRVDDATLAARKAAWHAPEQQLTGWLSRYARFVSGANEGAVLR